MTAEGVEDEATADALRAMGCELAQGYLYGAAMEYPNYLVTTIVRAGQAASAR